MKRMEKKCIGIMLLTAMVVSSICVSQSESLAAKKPYGDKLKLNNEIKLNKTKLYKKKGIRKSKQLFKEKVDVDVNYKIKCKRKSVGDNYVVKYNVKFEYLTNPKLQTDKIDSSDPFDEEVTITSPCPYYVVFDYNTGKSLDGVENDLNVSVKGKWGNLKYYPKQYYMSSDNQKYDMPSVKSETCSFTVTYPKKLKDVCVGIGFINYEFMDSEDENYNDYFDGTAPIGKCAIYKKGKDTMSYMRLNK